MGSISDIKFTCVSGFVKELHRKSGVSVMADRCFTIQDQLSAIGIGFNILLSWKAAASYQHKKFTEDVRLLDKQYIHYTLYTLYTL